MGVDRCERVCSGVQDKTDTCRMCWVIGVHRRQLANGGVVKWWCGGVDVR